VNGNRSKVQAPAPPFLPNRDFIDDTASGIGNSHDAKSTSHPTFSYPAIFFTRLSALSSMTLICPATSLPMVLGSSFTGQNRRAMSPHLLKRDGVLRCDLPLARHAAVFRPAIHFYLAGSPEDLAAGNWKKGQFWNGLEGEGGEG